PRNEPQQGDLNLAVDEPVPTLLNPVDDEPVEPKKAAKPAVDAAPVEEVLVINVVARDDFGFKGPALLQNILESGLRFGEMDIFRHHESMAGNGEVLFS
ncbi:cell division protein ZipA C-terminal FtsZ-binding domain-containing protein, partial [Escherichia coli]